MRTWSAVLMSSLLVGQDARPLSYPPAEVPAPSLRLLKTSLSPQDMIRAMVAQDQAHQREPGATVEVIGYDDEAALKLLSVNVAETVRLTFRNTDKLHHQELYAFMHQDPSYLSPVFLMPMLAGAKAKTIDDKWLR